MLAIPLVEVFDVEQFGGKAVQLGAALRAGLQVPPGYALAVATVDRVAAGDAAACAEIETCFATIGGACAVRSSAVGEDGAQASFAGQHATILNVRDRVALMPAIHQVWLSGRSAAALAYRKRIGADDSPRVAVVMQQLVLSDCAGVLFTRNPMSGADERVIEASWGLGEAVVAGLVTPDHFRVSRSGEILERTVGNKDLAIVPTADGGTAEIEIDAARAESLCLDDDQLRALGDLAGICEKVFGGDQDLEFAFASGQLYLLQRRPITRSQNAG